MAGVQVSEAEIQEFFDVALKLTKEAGVIVVDAISMEKEISTKASATDVVTATDKAVEKMLFDGLRLESVLKLSSKFVHLIEWVSSVIWLVKYS